MANVKNPSLFIIEDFFLPADSKMLMHYWDQNKKFCTDERKHHKKRTLHYESIQSEEMKNLLDYYFHKSCFFIGHYFNTKVTAWSPPRICCWRKGEHMGMHKDRQEDIYDTVNFSGLGYLNDNYQGGELLLKEYADRKPKANSFIFFKSDQITHGVSKIKKGSRYTLPSGFKYL